MIQIDKQFLRHDSNPKCIEDNDIIDLIDHSELFSGFYIHTAIKYMDANYNPTTTLVFKYHITGGDCF